MSMKQIGLTHKSNALCQVREYRNNSILAPHVDRFPLVTSCIINIAQDVDEDWPLEVFDHNGDAQNVTMVPGDIVLYESHSIIHGRPFPMKGRSFVNTFLHFQPLGPLGHAEKWGPIGDNNDLPPYVVPGGPWEEEFYKAGTAPWSIVSAVVVVIVIIIVIDRCIYLSFFYEYHSLINRTVYKIAIGRPRCHRSRRF